MADNNSKTIANGMGVDRSGGPVIDPTANVLALVEANNQRLDELRTADNKLTDKLLEDEKAHIREVITLQTQHSRELASQGIGRGSYLVRQHRCLLGSSFAGDGDGGDINGSNSINPFGFSER